MDATRPHTPGHDAWSVPSQAPHVPPVPQQGSASVPGRQAVPHPGQPVYHVTVSPKTPGIAILLTFLWLGAGHLYAGRTGPGVVPMVVDAFLVLLLLVPLVGWLLAPMIWIPLFIVAAITSSSAVKSYNRRLGIRLP